MQSFNIVKKQELKKPSFRVASICDQFDYTNNYIKEEFKGNIDLPDTWNIGLIVGKSGTGKTTIAKELFHDCFCNFEYKKNCVVDDFDKNISLRSITRTFSAVGFSTVPSWLKPYSVLSNGEKMRVNLARALLSDKEVIIFDEYTSVVDREVAKLGSLATYNIIKKTDKKFIAVSCHFDIIEWLQPDWIFSTDEMKMLPRGSLQRKPIRIEIRKTKGYWNIFRRYHYLNHSLNKTAAQFVGFYNDKPICFCAVINMPHPRIVPLRRGHRLVVLPDYQGLGIGSILNDMIAEYYKQKNEYFGVTTSLNGFSRSLIKNNKWKLIRMGKGTKNSKAFNSKFNLNATSSSNRNTYSFKYIGVQA